MQPRRIEESNRLGREKRRLYGSKQRMVPNGKISYIVIDAKIVNTMHDPFVIIG